MDDMISRQAAIDAVIKRDANCGIDSVEVLKTLPSVQPNRTENTRETHACDLIDRQAAIAVADFSDYVGLTVEDVKKVTDEVVKGLKQLPSAQPERKTGRWLIRKGISDAQCSECKMYFKDVYDIDNSDAFCRHCGAKMEGLKVVKRG